MADKKTRVSTPSGAHRQSESANLNDAIRITAALVGGGHGSAADVSRLIDQRVDLLYRQGLKAARARARQTVKD